MTQIAMNEAARLTRVAHNRRGLWVSALIELLGLLAFVLFFNFVWPNLGATLNDTALILLGLALALVPAVLWLFFFRRLDRLEPEPKQMLLTVFLLGALVTAALLRPILQGIFNIDDWLQSSWWLQLLGGILVVGFVEQTLVYLTVRLGIYSHREFDERVDGIIYGIAAGLGLATVLNFLYVMEGSGVDLDIGSIRIVVNALAYASFGGLVGYFIGQARFEKTPPTYLPIGIMIAATFNGLFFFLLDRTQGNDLYYNPWIDLILAAIVAGATLALLFRLVERANEETLRVAGADALAQQSALVEQDDGLDLAEREEEK